MEQRYHDMIILERLPSYKGDTEGSYFICKYSPKGMNPIFEEALKNYPEISYEKEKGFDGLVYERPLKYDFYLHFNGENVLIELDGVQHYDEKSNWHNESLRERDRIKNQYAIEHQIPLYRLPFTKTIKKFNYFLQQLLLGNQKFLKDFRVTEENFYNKKKTTTFQFFQDSGDPIFQLNEVASINERSSSPYLSANQRRVLEILQEKLKDLPRNTPIKRCVLDSRGLYCSNIASAKKYGFLTQEGCKHGYYKILV